MKLSKAQIKQHQEAEKLLAKEVLTYEDKIFVLDNWYPAYGNQIGMIASFFTPFNLAHDFMLEMTGSRIIDLCAGIGGLGLAYYENCRLYHNQTVDVVCIERNEKFVEVGKKILPQARWICSDVLCEDIYKELGRFDCAISNPPFGKIKSDTSSKWLKYKGSEFEYKVIEIGEMLSDFGAYIIPQMSAPFRYSGRQCYEESVQDKYVKFTKETGIILNPNKGIDCDAYKDEWKGASPTVEIVTTTKFANDNTDYFREKLEKQQEPIELPDGLKQGELFAA